MRFIRFEMHSLPDKKVWVINEHACGRGEGRFEFHNDGVECWGEALACRCRPRVPSDLWERYQKMSEVERLVYVVRGGREEVTYG